ncbi:kinesin-associated protein 3 isoform X3 [Anabrus simplex]|uniref:kinesin-associated protein 3 isoform X3 n=1 Tax=Anabrus simplex TaxID=316456 RepID=UPI0034DD4CB4
MQSDDARYLKRKIRSRSIDVHPTEQALVVTYELEALILGDLGDPLLGNRKECQKIIRLKSLNENTNCAALAKEVVEKCSLIHPNKLEEVKHLISYLQKRKITGSAGEQGESPRPSSSCSSTDVAALNSVPAEKISINDIEQYVELLYEDIPEKINGSALILQLARVPDNLVELANNVIIYLLLNMAENTKVEDKMRKKNICGMLAKTLDRDNPNLLHLVVTFLRKLSLFRENVDDMADLNVVEKLPKVLMINNPDVIEVTLQLLFNLSFDTHLRERMVRVGFIPKVVSLLTDQRYETIVLKILYHLSMDDRCKSMFTYTDCIPLVMNMLLQSPEDELHLELIALCINLAINKRNAQMMVENNRLQCLMERAFRNQDSLIMKMIRNIAQHEGTKQNFVEFVGDIAQAIVQCENEDFVVECVGVLGNMTLPDLDFSQLMQRFNMIPWITNILVPGKFEDDLVLEVVVLLGTAAADEGCATLLCKADILISLIELLKAKQEDDEMVLQIIYVFYQISRHVATRDYLIKETEAPAYLIDLMHDKNTQIRKVCNACLEIIAECNKDWAERIKLEKFRWHNSQWLEMVESSTIDDTAYGAAGDMDELPSFYTDDMIQRTLLYPSNSDFELDRPEDLQPINDNKISSEPGSRPRSGHSHEMEADYGEPLFHKSGLSSSNSSEDLVRNGLNNLVLGPLLSSDSDLEKMDEPQYVMI